MEPYGVLLCISPLVGKLLHSGEIMPRPLDLDEIEIFRIPPQEILQINFSSYEEALSGLSQIMQEIKEKYETRIE